MKAALHVIFGALLGAAFGVLGSVTYDRLFGAGYPLNDEQSNTLAIVLVFGVLPASTLVGAITGYALHRRRVRKI
ncbi:MULTISPECIES: hypothetical protein [unclassified Acidovorax]|uniref:hypothetical protein n=1 Tax=unclassified Acidovorax TaxID=2684926 RepID=UPI00234B8829|nr:MULTISPECIES: hypothetical protein [unclassified Acidovorax]WCN00250.1 hypothetical protein M5C96_13115 [Acidovorax sp. GBBC 1281]GKS95659.1 hypothetical protein AVAK2825_14010 [Acidovorax sp. SUPP2825]GKT17300.1 hypothetical protein AVHY2522_14740 [Acidovorax sp. SUPP2522]